LPDRTEKDLLLIEHALQAAAKPRLYEAVLDLPAVLQELEGWLADDHQWQSGKSHNWATLLADLASSWEKLGSNLQSLLGDGGAKHAFDETQHVQKALKGGGHSPDESTRRRLKGAAEAIRSNLLNDCSLRAAWADLIETSGPAEAVSSARLLLALGSLRGDAPESLVRRIGGILGDEYVRVTIARGDTPEREGEEFPRSANASPSERLELAEATLTQLPREANVVVWLLYALAPKKWPPVLNVGEKVVLYDAEWLGTALEAGAAAYPIPDELKGEGLGKHLVTRDRENSGDNSNPVPRVAVRFDLGRVRVPEAEEIARRSAEALIALASLHGGHSCPWIVEDSFSMFIDGADGPWSMAAPAFSSRPRHNAARCPKIGPPR
jgi:hypothetical protein